MNYAWIITFDHLEGRAVEISGPHDATFTKDDVLDLGREFTLHDGDGALYFTGKLLGGDGFEPLDDYGAPAAGCTEIRYGGKPL